MNEQYNKQYELVMRYLEQSTQVSYILAFTIEQTEDRKKALRLMCVRCELIKHTSRIQNLLLECSAENDMEIKLATLNRIIATSDQALKDALNSL